MTAARISVVIDTYNHEQFVAHAIESVLRQDFPREQMEILVVDDGSTDGTPEAVRKFEPQVRLLRKSNGGQASAINCGVAHATGEFIAFLDGDDAWLPNKLSRVMAEFEHHPEAVLVYHKWCFWDARDGHVWEPERALISGDILDDREKLAFYWAAPTSSLVFRTAALKRLTPVPEECSYNHDTYLITAAIFLGPVAAIGECLTRNRIHGQNLYFAGRGEQDVKVLRNRVVVRAAAIKALRGWMLANAPRSKRREVRFLVRRWQLVQDGEEFQLSPPGRLRSFSNKIRGNLVFGFTMTRSRLAYRWVYAIFELVVGPEHSHYLESVRTRAVKLRDRLRARLRATKHTSETAGPVQ